MNQLKSKVDEIAQFLGQFHHPASNYGLYGGDLGRLLFLFHYAEATGSQKFFDLAIEGTEKCVESAIDSNNSFAFCSGLSGLCWFLEYVVGKGWLDANTNEIISDLDESLNDYMVHSVNSNNYDFLYGAIGVGF